MSKNIEENGRHPIMQFFFLPVIHELVRERRFPHFFRSQYPGERVFPRESPVCLVTGFEKSAEIAILGLIVPVAGGNAGI